MPAHRSTPFPLRRSRRLSKQEPRNYAEDDWEGYDLSSGLADGVTAPVAPSSSHQPFSALGSFAEGPPSASRLSSSHQRPGGHVSRPPNAFMLFRSDFWAKEKQKDQPIERDHRDISRIAAHCWNHLSAEERARYQKLAEQRKQLHRLEHPDYSYSPGVRREKPVKRKVKKADEAEEERCRRLANLVMDGVSEADIREAMKNMKTKKPGGKSARSSRPRRQSISSASSRKGAEKAGFECPLPEQNTIQAGSPEDLRKARISSPEPPATKDKVLKMDISPKPPSYEFVEPQFDCKPSTFPFEYDWNFSHLQSSPSGPHDNPPSPTDILAASDLPTYFHPFEPATFPELGILTTSHSMDSRSLFQFLDIPTGSELQTQDSMENDFVQYLNFSC